MKVILRKKAQNSIAAITEYIDKQGYPDTAYKFSVRLEKFSETLAVFPDKYSICRHPQFAKHNYHCAVFEDNYIFVYKVVRQQPRKIRISPLAQLVIYNVIHGRRLK